MTSKVSGKTRLGAVCCVLLIAIALFAGCKQETPESYAPPGYGVSVGPLTDTVWEATNGDTFKFAANGKVSVPESMKTKTFYGEKIELGDFTYTCHSDEILDDATKVTIAGVVKKLPNGEDSQTFRYYDGGYSGNITVNVGDTINIKTLTINGKRSNTAADYDKIGPYNMIDDDLVIYSTTVPTRENYVGDYYDEEGRKVLQIREDGTTIGYSNGEQDLQYWKYIEKDTVNEDMQRYKGTVLIANSKEELNSQDYSGSPYHLYPHAFMAWEANNFFFDIGGVYWK